MTSAKLNSAMPGRGDVTQASQPASRGSIRAPRSPIGRPVAGQGCPANPQAGKPALRAFSLIEILIAVTLMSVIVLGLMAMFSETQRAFRTGITQVDVMEGGRSALEMMARELEQATPTRQPGAANFRVGNDPFVGAPGLGSSPGALQPYVLNQPLLGSSGQQRQNILQDFVFMTREGQEWKAIGYAVVYTNYIGSLYRYETNFSAVADEWPKAAYYAYNTFFSGNPGTVSPSRVMGNVVNLRVHTYDHLGRLLSPNYNYLNYPSTPTLDLNLVNPTWGTRNDDISVAFYSNALPAYVEIELGILEAKTADRARAIGEDSLAQQQLFLEKQAGKVQVFRQRVPIRNVDPSVYQ